MTGVRLAGLAGVRAVIFDFNGTITDDESLQYEIYAELFTERHGIVLERDTYFTELAGLSDPGIVDRVAELSGLVLSTADRATLLTERVRRYAARVAYDPPVRPGAAALIQALMPVVPMAVGTGAFRAEAELVLRSAGLLDSFGAIVTIEDVERGKPDPQTFQLALAKLNALPKPDGLAKLDALASFGPFTPADVVVFEDSMFGVAAAQAAGMRCVLVQEQAPGRSAAVPPVTTDDVSAAGGGADVVVESLHPGLLALGRPIPIQSVPPRRLDDERTPTR